MPGLQWNGIGIGIGSGSGSGILIVAYVCHVLYVLCFAFQKPSFFFRRFRFVVVVVAAAAACLLVVLSFVLAFVLVRGVF